MRYADPDDGQQSHARLAEMLRRLGSGRLVVITGAGVSAASGLPTFRGDDPGAIWANGITEIATIEYFRRDPVGWWTWFLDRFEGILDVEPNEAHRSIARIETGHVDRGGGFLLVTQNVDTLHEKAGSTRLAKVHGSADRVRCSRFGCPSGAPRGSLPIHAVDLTRLKSEPRVESLPRCPDCGAIVRAHALLFDEFYAEHEDYRFEEVQEALFRAGLILFVGTSFSVGLTELALQACRSLAIPAFSIDPGGSPPPGVIALHDQAEVVLPRVTDLLGW